MIFWGKVMGFKSSPVEKRSGKGDEDGMLRVVDDADSDDSYSGDGRDVCGYVVKLS